MVALGRDPQVKTGLTSVKPDGILVNPRAFPSPLVVEGRVRGYQDAMVTPRGSKGANPRAAL